MKKILEQESFSYVMYIAKYLLNKWICMLFVNFKFYLKNSNKKMLTSKINFIEMKIF